MKPCELPNPVKTECDYIPPDIKTIHARIVDGQWQVQLNGEGKWIDATYNQETNSLTFLS